MLALPRAASSLRAGATALKAGWKREEKGRTRLLQHALQSINRQIDRHPERFEHVRPAAARGDAAVAVLGQFGPRPRGDEHDRGGNVEQPELVAARAADIEQRPNAGWRGKGLRVTKEGLGKCSDFLR